MSALNNIHGLNSGSAGRAGGGGNGGGGGSGTPGCMDQVKSGWISIPLFNKFIFTTLTGCLVLSYFTPIAGLCMLAPGYLLTF
jgi:hypothetical protein